MGDSTGHVLAYLAPDVGSPWRWAEDGRVLTWVDGGTIAFRPEVERVLQRLAAESQVVPPFLELVLLFAALRAQPRGGFDETRVTWMTRRIEACAAGPESKSAAMAALAEVVAASRVIANVPGDFWSQETAIENLAVHVVERSGQPRDPHAATQMIRTLSHGLPPWVFNTTTHDRSRELEHWIETFSLLRHAFSRFDAEALLLRARTGLEGIPGAVDVPIDSRAGARDLIEALRQDTQLGALAGIAREVAALVHVPRPMAERSDLASGGVSDISNRGSLERLLPSELAHDDLTLAIRIATNEALYTRRESPQRPRSGARNIVVDVGIRSWGTPRVFAAAVTLGLAAASDRRDRAWVWHTGGAPLAQVDLTSREGLLEFLSVLNPDPDPSDAFDAVFDATRTAGAPREIFLVTTPEAAQSSSLRARLTERRSAGYFLVTVDATGALRVESVGAHGSRVLHDAHLDVGALQRGTSDTANARPTAGESASDVSVPRFLSLRPYPLRVTAREERARFCLREENGRVQACVLTPQGDLQFWDGPTQGGRVIATFGNSMRVPLCEFDALGQIHVVSAPTKRGPWRWLRIDPWTLVERVHELPVARALDSAALVDGKLVLVGHGRLSVIDDASDTHHGSGEVHVQGEVECGTHLQGRYFRRGTQLTALTVSGGHPVFVNLTGRLDRPDEVIALFDWPGHDGPWAISRGSPLVESTARGELIDVSYFHVTQCTSLHFAWPWYVVVNLDKVIDLENGRAYSFKSPLLSGLAAHRETAFSSLQSIGRSAQGHLLVRSQSSKNYEICVRESTRPPQLIVAPAPRGDAPRHHFTKQLSPWNGYRTATTPNGTSAWSDWRGWLHLKHADPRVPEITIALTHDRPLRAWCSEGWSHGNEALLLEGPTRGADEVAEWLRVYAEEFS